MLGVVVAAGGAGVGAGVAAPATEVGGARAAVLQLLRDVVGGVLESEEAAAAEIAADSLFPASFSSSFFSCCAVDAERLSEEAVRVDGDGRTPKSTVTSYREVWIHPDTHVGKRGGEREREGVRESVCV